MGVSVNVKQVAAMFVKLQFGETMDVAICFQVLWYEAGY